MSASTIGTKQPNLPEGSKRLGSSRRLGVVSIGLVALSAWLKRQLVPTHRYLPWHQTQQWHSFLRVYDEQVNKYYFRPDNVAGIKDCVSKLLDTTYGGTNVVACGSPNHKPIFFFHGAGLNGLMYGDWILPQMQSKDRYVIAVDTLCDTGRSVPLNSDPNRCPATIEEMADWVRQLVTHPVLRIQSPASMVGFSYGALISFLAARYHPKLVDKLVLLSPACVFDGLNPQFLYRAMIMALFRSRATQAWFWKWMSADQNFDFTKSLSSDFLQNLEESRKVAGTLFAVPAQEFDDDILSQVASQHDIFLGIGSEERAILNSTRAADRAQQAGVQTVRVYHGSGHLLCLEIPETVEQDVVAFLTK